MAYENYLIRLYAPVGSSYYDIPLSVIKLDSYKVTWESQDYSAYRDGYGELHRTAIESRPPKVEFYIRGGMTNVVDPNHPNSCLNTLMANIKNFIHVKKERKYRAKIYIPEINDYVVDYVYMVDPTFSIYRIDGNTIYYNSFRMAFIGYGKSTSWSDK